MLKIQHLTNYLKKNGLIQKSLSRYNKHALKRRSILKRFKRSDDSLELPGNFEIGTAVVDGNCFFNSFRQGLEQQLE